MGDSAIVPILIYPGEPNIYIHPLDLGFLLTQTQSYPESGTFDLIHGVIFFIMIKYGFVPILFRMPSKAHQDINDLKSVKVLHIPILLINNNTELNLENFMTQGHQQDLNYRNSKMRLFSCCYLRFL